MQFLIILTISLTGERLFAYNHFMVNIANNKKIQVRVKLISDFYRKSGRMPSFSEIGQLFRLKSKNSVFKVVNKLEKTGLLKRDHKGRLIPLSMKQHTKVLGTIEAGFPSPAEEELIDTISLDDLLIQNKDATFLLKVTGDSLKDAGILPGDMVIVDKSLNPVNGDIVIAQVDGEWTMKIFKKRGNSIILMPANPKYKPIQPKNELKVAGVVASVIRKYK